MLIFKEQVSRWPMYRIDRHNRQDTELLKLIKRFIKYLETQKDVFKKKCIVSFFVK